MPIRHPLHRGSAVILLAALAGCGPEAPPPEVPPAPPPTPVDTAAPAPQSPRASWENPGGMWMPEQMPEHAETLKKLGLEIDPGALADPASGTLGAVVSLGGCSASFVSDEGLVITNHHCVVSALQYNSTPKENLLVNGFLAKTRAEERSSGPTARVYVTQGIRKVTAEMREGIAEIKDDLARHKKIEEHEKALIAACEKGRPSVRCSVAEFFGGAEYRLIEQLEIKDVRLVYAPHDQIGDFGGEVDNWHWPRHSGDVALLRAYVGRDGKPAEHSKDNVPYRPQHRLKLATKPLSAGDLVMVAGYPGTTNRLRTWAEAVEAEMNYYPNQIQWCDENIAALEKLFEKGPEVKIKAMPTWRGLNNLRTKMRGIVDGLGKGGITAKIKQDEEARVANSAPHRDTIEAIRRAVEARRPTRAHDLEITGMTRLVTLYGAAMTLVRMAEERDKPDHARDPAYQERNWERLAQAQEQLQKKYARPVDELLFKVAMLRALRLSNKERPEIVTAVMGKGRDKITDKRIEDAISALYQDTKLGELATRMELLKRAKIADLQKSKDPLIQLALKMRPAHKAAEERAKAYDAAMVLVRPRLVESFQKTRTGPLAPDANGTLRLTFGTVRGYQPTKDAFEYEPFTTVSGMVQKNKGAWPFDAPGYLLDAIKAKKFGPYVDPKLGEVPIDFLSDLDITSGNSGSATLNARGEIVGLAFDGNYESMASDWSFMPKVTRTIHVDMRYVLWLLDAISGGQHLIKEMGGAPAF